MIRALGVDRDVSGMTGVPTRSAFLIRDGETIVAAWMLGSELPDHRRGDRGRENQKLIAVPTSDRRPWAFEPARCLPTV